MVESAQTRAKELNMPLRLMFEDEARFGRMSSTYAAWAPKPMRPMVELALVREFEYVYCAVSPQDGKAVWTTQTQMNTDCMSHFLREVSKTFPDEMVFMILDGASCHKAKALELPANIILGFLPPYSPELNPTEHIWDEMREKFFANRIFESMDIVRNQINKAIEHFKKNEDLLRSITFWPWIKNAILV